MKEKTPLSRNCVLSYAQICGKLVLSLKLHYFRGRRFFTMFYTINLSPILVTKTGFMIIIIFSNY